MTDTKTGKGFSADEKAAMRERAKELKAESRSKADRADGRARPAREDRRDAAGRSRHGGAAPQAHHRRRAPHLTPKTWYGMPAYAKDGKLVCFFKAAAKFNSRYATFGFEEAARLDDGTMWPTSYALTELTAADEKRIGELVKKAAG